MILRARTVVPMQGPPISDGAVLVRAGQIQAVGPWNSFRALRGQPHLDLGERVILPGLINAHCHLDYTNMAGLIRPQERFTDWIQHMMVLKASWGYSEFAQSWLDGARMLLQSGTTTVIDVEAVPELMPEVWAATPLRVISMREVIHLKAGRATDEKVERTTQEWAAVAGARTTGLSPHSPYSTHPELLRQAGRMAKTKRWLLTTHLAESAEEFQMFKDGQGHLYDWLKDQRNMEDCGKGSPVQHFDRCGYLSPRLLAVHVNYLAPNDAALLGKRRVSVVHCPRSHAYFRHHPFPYDALHNAGVNLCLGTDSLATTRKVGRAKLELNLFAEMRAFAEHHPQVPARAILEMVTVGPARALGRATKMGSFLRGARADLIVLPYSGGTEYVFEAIVHHRGKIDGSMIDGRWVIELP